jgi:hypothetical protein
MIELAFELNKKADASRLFYARYLANRKTINVYTLQQKQIIFAMHFEP